MTSYAMLCQQHIDKDLWYANVTVSLIDYGPAPTILGGMNLYEQREIPYRNVEQHIKNQF